MLVLAEVTGKKLEQQIKRTLTAVGDRNILRPDLPAAPGFQKRREPVDQPGVTSCTVVFSNGPLKLLAVGKQVDHRLPEMSLSLGNAGGIASTEKPHFRAVSRRAFDILHESQDS